MKAQYHLKKNKVYVQLTDGSIYRKEIISKVMRLKLSLDPKSALLWKHLKKDTQGKNYANHFMNKFFSRSK